MRLNTSLSGFESRSTTEITLPLELYWLLDLGVGECRLKTGLAQRFERIRIEIGSKVFAAAGIGLGE